ncbi:MAG: hypothetical protein GF411_11480 [Candidatus Lokiarchaeota archaeon]|nr:hypothetical protein [Candidatus Lokiarchaeota archaeon]
MSGFEEKPLDKLTDIIYGVRAQNLLAVWSAIRKKMDEEGAEAVKDAFTTSKKRFIEGPFEEHLEVRWGMDLCPHCNDSNKETNGIAYPQPNGDGLEFNQCLNCRIGLLYTIRSAKATLDTYAIGLGEAGQFNGMTIFWDAIVPDEMDDLLPLYEVHEAGKWIGTISFNDQMEPSFLPFEEMKDGVPRGAKAPWTTDIPEALQAAIDDFKDAAKDQIEVSLAIR